jgi:hypothetical protein
VEPPRRLTELLALDDATVAADRVVTALAATLERVVTEADAGTPAVMVAVYARVTARHALLHPDRGDARTCDECVDAVTGVAWPP